MCGEKYKHRYRRVCVQGSPPHVRGKDTNCANGRCSLRITPACAGKREKGCTSPDSDEDHPRMCGEKFHVLNCPLIGCGITPACAGKRLKRSRSTVPPVAIVPLFPSVCNKPVVSDGSPAGRDAPLFLPAENAVPASPAYNLRSL